MARNNPCLLCFEHIHTIKQLRAENDKLKEKLRRIELEGWKGKDELQIGRVGQDWVIEEHRKDKLTDEIATVTYTIPEVRVIKIWDIICEKCKITGSSTNYRELVPSILETYHFPIEIEEFNGGKNRAKYYFKYYYYPIKILEHLGMIRYGGRGKIVRLG